MTPWFSFHIRPEVGERVKNMGFDSPQSARYLHLYGNVLCVHLNVCVSPVEDREMDVPPWIEGGRNKCLIHLTDLVQWCYWGRLCDYTHI